MKKNIKNFCRLVLFFGFAAVGLSSLTACNPEPDESALFTDTGETADDYIKRKSELSAFNYILTRVGLDRNLAAYGQYTVFAPDNEAIEAYADSLYNDVEAIVPHNGMSDATIEGLTDSLCLDLARFHICAGQIYTTIDMGGAGIPVTTMLGRAVNTKSGADYQGNVVIENEAVIYIKDSVVTNGIVHTLNKVIPKSSRYLPNELEHHEEFSIFTDALRLTGLEDSLMRYKKLMDEDDFVITDWSDTDGKKLYHPTECLIKYTIFAETDEVFREAGINNIDDLIAYANNVYGSATDWYDYASEMGWTINTETDKSNADAFKQRNNALNMFVAYHLLYAGMPETDLVYEQNAARGYWNYVNGAEPFDYYETMLPNTLLKIWQPQPGRALYINRYVKYNTRTNEVGTMGKAGFHELVRSGVRIWRTTDSGHPDTNISAYNGYIHALRGILVYDEMVPRNVLNERLRFDTTTFLPEFINNNIRMRTMSDFQALAESGARVAFPNNYFNNVVSYNDEVSGNQFRYNVKGAYNAWQSDTFQGWGNYDFAVKLPPLPTGTYEFRIFYTPMGHGSMMQFYMGNSREKSSMIALGIPLDVRIEIGDERIGWTNYLEDPDMGLAVDAAMRNRGYMRGLYSYCDHPERGDANVGGGVGTNTDRNQRYTSTGNNSLRRIMGRVEFKQSEEKWFRLKNLVSDRRDLKWQLDYVEFVPVSWVDDNTTMEDWY